MLISINKTMAMPHVGHSHVICMHYQQALKLMSSPLTECVSAPTEI